jgi:predicted Rossmann fold nucleotide-binding protein DprA/Smf involved in DNA uptake
MGERRDSVMGGGRRDRPTGAARLTPLAPGDPRYPADRLERLLPPPLPLLLCAGSLELLAAQSLGILSSRRCPGSIILRMHDFASTLRLKEIVAVGGFQSPLERHCLELFTTGRVRVIYTPARSLNWFRPRGEWRRLTAQGRLLVVSSSTLTTGRPTVRDAIARNGLVGALASVVLIPHAAPGSRTMAMARSLLAASRRVFTFDDPSNRALVEEGAIPVESLQW